MGLISRAKAAYTKHGAAGFTIAAIGFAIVEGIMAYRAGKRCGQHPEWTEKEKMMNVVAPVAAGAGTVVCIAASQHKNAGEIATLASSQLLNEKKRQQWIKKAEETLGKENIEKIKASMHPVKDEEVAPRPDGRILFIDDFTGARTYSTREEMLKAIDKFHAYYHTNQYAAYGKLLEYGKFERFDGVNRAIPISEDDEGNPLDGLSDMDIGFSSCKQWNDGWETDWIDVWIVDHVDPKSGNEYCTIETGMYPVANFMNY